MAQSGRSTRSITTKPRTAIAIDPTGREWAIACPRPELRSRSFCGGTGERQPTPAPADYSKSCAQDLFSARSSQGSLRPAAGGSIDYRALPLLSADWRLADYQVRVIWWRKFCVLSDLYR